MRNQSSMIVDFTKEFGLWEVERLLNGLSIFYCPYILYILYKWPIIESSYLPSLKWIFLIIQYARLNLDVVFSYFCGLCTLCQNIFTLFYKWTIFSEDYFNCVKITTEFGSDITKPGYCLILYPVLSPPPNNNPKTRPLPPM